VSPAQGIRVQLESNKSNDAADIDYLAVTLTTGTTTADTTTADTTPPSTPTGLAVTGTTPSSVSLSWAAATDHVGVTG
jgi:hypothetical protein